MQTTARIWVLLSLLVLALAGGLSCAQRPPRLVLLVIIDTLRADRLGCYGYDPIATPHLDQLAAQGILYENAFAAAPVTLPSVATILTGAYPLQHGIRDNGAYRLDAEWRTLAEQFRAGGYRTGAFVSAAVISRMHGLDQGFDCYDDDCSMPYQAHDPDLVPFADGHQNVERRADETVDRALAWALAEPGRRTFLFVHLFDPHLPRDPPPPFATTYRGRPYEGEIAFTDQEFGRLLAGLREGWSPSRILTLVAADHGEGLGDHGEEFHGFLLYDQLVRVPLILQGPGLARGVRIPDVVRTIDIAPTLTDLAGLAVGEAVAGEHLPRRAAAHAQWASGGRGQERVAYLETFRPRLSYGWCELRALRTRAWKLIEGPEWELYDLAVDPHERHDLAAARPGVRDSLQRALEAAGRASLTCGIIHASRVSLSEPERERLASLGYVTAEGAGEPAPPESLAIWHFPPERRGVALGLPNPRTELAAYQRRVAATSLERAGRLALAQGNQDRAEDYFRRAIEKEPHLAAPRLGLAEVRRARGDRAGALRVLRDARQACPEDSSVARALGVRVGSGAAAAP